MTEPKYQIGDRLYYENQDLNLFVRGVMTFSTGNRYFIQIGTSDNSFTIDDHEMDEMLARCATDYDDF